MLFGGGNNNNNNKMTTTMMMMRRRGEEERRRKKEGVESTSGSLPWRVDVLWSLMARSAATEVVRGRRAVLLRAAIELRRRRSDADMVFCFFV